MGRHVLEIRPYLGLCYEAQQFFIELRILVIVITSCLFICISRTTAHTVNLMNLGCLS